MAAPKKTAAKPKFVSVALNTNGVKQHCIVALREDGVVYRKQYGRDHFEKLADLSAIE